MTLTGPGGVGKTRLALEVARRQVGRRTDGVWLVDLAAAPEVLDVAAETARTLDVGSRRDATWTDALVSHLAERDPLLVLDNCEHVIEASAELVDNCSPPARTSGSWPPAAKSSTCRGSASGGCTHLRKTTHVACSWNERARRPEFMPDERADETIARICERLDRLPLAIELAAARVGVMSAEEILAGLESRLGELGGGRLAPPRHRTVRATVDWSHKLLDTAEQEALRNLAVFVGGFDTEAGIAVAPGLS